MTDIHKWETQLYKGILELCVLVLLKNKEFYGGEILQQLNLRGLSLPEGTLYPLLNRMQRNGWLCSRWVHPTDRGHPRRYYSLSNHSTEAIPLMVKKFSILHKIITKEDKNESS